MQGVYVRNNSNNRNLGFVVTDSCDFTQIVAVCGVSEQPLVYRKWPGLPSTGGAGN